ncbi:IS701 family transposase [Nocardia sp. NPDC101769]|uniref:IS701 family transposase n=1 Tax=Nocardia sp. NPDC101769 TaxID=3364333 RepID=UPI0037FC7865
MGRVAGRFRRVEPRRTAREMVAGLASELPEKNCWTLSEHAGHDTPDAMQHLLSRAVWDADAVRDDLRDYVVQSLGGREAILVIDETGDVKKGTTTVGVQRQYTGTAGRIENSQVAVFLTYSTRLGHTLIDRALYLPKSWTTDPDRRAEAGIPDSEEFATKPALAQTMIDRALDAGVSAAWVTGDEVYGADPTLRSTLEAHAVGYVLAIGRDRRVATGTGPIRADRLTAALPATAWQPLSAGDGAKGPRLYEWAWITLDTDTAGYRWLLVRRNPATGELAYYRSYCPHQVPLSTLVGVAGRRWGVEEDFKAGKGLAGLDQHQVRTWRSWHRWTVLSMLALALLTILAATEPTHNPEPQDLIPLTRNEIRHLLATVFLPPNHDIGHRFRRSRWRRRHQHRAKTSHYQRRHSKT